VHLYNDSELNWHLENGIALKVTQKTNYPWDGRVDITVTPAQASDFTFYLRIPGWAESALASVNNKPVAGAKPGQYLPIERKWSPGDMIRLQMEMPPQVIQANPRVIDDAGRVAVQRGPLVYCLEELDQPDGVSLVNVALDLASASSDKFQSQLQTDLLNGVVVLRHAGRVYENDTNAKMLYSGYRGVQTKSRQVPLTFIPYYAWANRQATSMQVWTPLYKA
jgi:DUF1680 family protein